MNSELYKLCSELNEKAFLAFDNSIISVADAKDILQSNGIGLITFEYYVDGFVRYRGDLDNGNEVIIDVLFTPLDSYQLNYECDDIEIIDKYTTITEIRESKESPFLFDSPKKGIEGIVGSDDSKIYNVR